MKQIIICIICLLIPFASVAQNKVTGFRAHDKDSHSRFVIDLNEKPEYKAFTLENPPRAVIDIKKAVWDNNLSPHSQTKRIRGVRYSPNTSPLRIVLDLNTPVKILENFVLEPKEGYKYRLVLDLRPLDLSKEANATPIPVVRSGVTLNAPKPINIKPYKPLIVIDAGHGGHDPGAIGYRKTYEKDITLAYSKELRRQLLATGRYRVYMTRQNDKYLKLWDRVVAARKEKGDMFISIHANSHNSRKVSGLSVYTLSETASDKEAAALARKENKAGLINGIDLEKESDEITEVLIDMTQRETKNVSASFAETIVEQAHGEVKLLTNPHRFAGFRVLKGADIPSVLIELGYLTNRKEEKLLNSKNYKKKLAKAFVDAIDEHFEKYNIDYNFASYQ
jgi:N-acetylmuramoyl-L-alanine amidase